MNKTKAQPRRTADRKIATPRAPGKRMLRDLGKLDVETNRIVKNLVHSLAHPKPKAPEPPALPVTESVIPWILSDEDSERNLLLQGGNVNDALDEIASVLNLLIDRFSGSDEDSCARGTRNTLLLVTDALFRLQHHADAHRFRAVRVEKPEALQEPAQEAQHV